MPCTGRNAREVANHVTPPTTATSNGTATHTTRVKASKMGR